VLLTADPAHHFTDEKALLRAMFDFGYFQPNTPTPR
jgi:hypothetical protein